MYFIRRKDFYMETSNYCVIYNPLSCNKNGANKAIELCERMGIEERVDITTIKDYAEFFSTYSDMDIIICGGDGTLNRFVNDTADLEIKNKIFFYPSGTGNDFLRDIEENGNDIIDISKYIKNLPICTVNGKDYMFINGIGYGIDGYCCEVGDKLRAQSSDKPINYTSIAIKGLLFHYKPTNATVTVDGVTKEFKKVWIAPAMLGRFYGGGMMPTPAQSRFDPEGKLSLMLFHGTGKLKTLMIFPSLFKGEHIKHKKSIAIFTGHEITVKFDSPRALQIDGETVLGVTEYSVRSSKSTDLDKKKEEVAYA